MSEQNKQLVRTLVDAFNANDMEGFAAACTDTYAYHGPGQQLTGVEAVVGMIQMYKGAFSDARLTILDQIAEGDKVCTRLRATGTHDGPLQDIAATGKPVSIALTAVYRIEGGKVAEEWETFEELQMLQQIGAIPTEGEAAA